MKNVPALNRIFAISVALISVSFFIAGLAAAFLAAAGVPFFYGYILIELFPYQDSVIDIFVGTMRVMAGFIPVFAVMGLSNIIVSYLTKGGSSARRELASMVRGFAYQLRHPFSDPTAPIIPSESVHNPMNDRSGAAGIKLIETLTRYAEGRLDAVGAGLESPELSSLLVEKYAVGLVDAVRSLSLDIDVNLLAAEADRLCLLIDPNTKENRLLRYSRFAKLDLSTGRR